jgi:hypothetical protein
MKGANAWMETHVRKTNWHVHSGVFVSHAAMLETYAARITLVIMIWSVGQTDIANHVGLLIIRAAAEERAMVID